MQAEVQAAVDTTELLSLRSQLLEAAVQMRQALESEVRLPEHASRAARNALLGAAGSCALAPQAVKNARGPPA